MWHHLLEETPMTLPPQAPHPTAPSLFTSPPDDLRRRARASGQEVWEPVSGTNVYTSFDRPGVVRTLEEVRAHRNTFTLRVSSVDTVAPF
jgi:hypothetical protein